MIKLCKRFQSIYEPFVYVFGFVSVALRVLGSKRTACNGLPTRVGLRVVTDVGTHIRLRVRDGDEWLRARTRSRT